MIATMQPIFMAAAPAVWTATLSAGTSNHSISAAWSGLPDGNYFGAPRQPNPPKVRRPASDAGRSLNLHVGAVMFGHRFSKPSMNRKQDPADPSAAALRAYWRRRVKEPIFPPVVDSWVRIEEPMQNDAQRVGGNRS